VGAHEVRGGRLVTGLKRREQPLVQRPVRLGRNRGELARHDDVPLRPRRDRVPVLDQHLVVRPAVDHAVECPVDVMHAANRYGQPGVPQVAERFALIPASDQRSPRSQFLRRHLRGREPRREQVELPPDGDEVGRLFPGKRRDHHVPVRAADHQVVRLEPAQGLAQRGDGDAKGGRKLDVVDPAARLEGAKQDLVAHLQVGAVGLGRRPLG